MHRAGRYSRIAAATLFLLLAPRAYAQAQAPLSDERRAQILQEAATLINAGHSQAAEGLYDLIIDREPTNVEARLGRGYVRSWQRNYEGARVDFEVALEVQPKNPEAHNGLGFVAAWTGNYDEAEQHFERALASYPGQKNATKGLAYVALWRGNHQLAIDRFTKFLEAFPQEAEGWVGLGQAHYAAGNVPESRRSFARAQQLEPARSDAAQGVAATRAPRTMSVEASLWAGRTFFHSDFPLAESGDSGIRFAEVAFNPNGDTRFWYQYENGLSRDNVSLAAANISSPTHFVGGLVHYQERFITRADFGWRNLPGDIGQKIFRVEQVFLTDVESGTALKIGGWYGPRDDDRTEWLAHAGYNFPAGDRIRFEPVFFYSRSGLPGERQYRGMLFAEGRLPNHWLLGGGFAAGRARTTTTDFFGNLVATNRTVWDAFGKLSTRFFGPVQAHVLGRYESFGNGTGLSLLAGGVTFKFAP